MVVLWLLKKWRPLRNEITRSWAFLRVEVVFVIWFYISGLSSKYSIFGGLLNILGLIIELIIIILTISILKERGLKKWILNLNQALVWSWPDKVGSFLTLLPPTLSTFQNLLGLDSQALSAFYGDCKNFRYNLTLLDVLEFCSPI